MKRHKKRIEEVQDLIIEVASGNFDAKGTISENQDELDAIIAGINMLTEELKYSTVSRDYLDSIYRGIVDMIIILDTEGKIQSVNEETVKVLGYKETELIGAPFEKILYGQSKRFLSSIYSKTIFRSLEKNFKTKKGNRIPVTCSGSKLYNKSNDSDGLLCIARDISKLKRYEEALLNKNKEMDQFVYKASHDIKGPLISIIGLTNIASKETQEQNIIEYLSMISKTASRLNETLMSLLQLAVSEKAKKDVKEFNLSQLIRDILQSLCQKPGYSEMTFKIKISDDLTIKNNFTLLNSVLQNLIDNAIKYKKSGNTSSVEISAFKSPGRTFITVKDNGIGIPAEFQTKVFDIFFRGTERSEGSGLGLYIVKNYTEKLGGSLSLKSKEGKGSTFELDIPDLTI